MTTSLAALVSGVLAYSICAAVVSIIYIIAMAICFFATKDTTPKPNRKQEDFVQGDG